MSWLAVHVRTAHLNNDAVAGALFAAGANGIEESPDGLVAYVPRDADIAVLRAALAASGAVADIREIADRDWSSEWKKDLTAHTAGRFTIAPPWLANAHPAGARIIIDPGMGFGTGEHPSTRSALVLMQRWQEPAAAVADAGAGSGVLSIGAALCGARSVAAIEIDADALENLEENIAANGVQDRITLLHGDAQLLLPLLAPLNLIVANIISSVIRGLLPVFREALGAGGIAVLSGILVSERDEMLATLRGAGWNVVDEIAEGDWCAFAIRR